MTMEFDGYVLDFPGITRTLSWPVDAEFEGVATLGVVADVIAAFAPLLRPQSIDVLLRAYHRDTQEEVPLTHPFWFAATTAAEADLSVSPSTGSAVRRRVDVLTPAAVGALINEAVAMEKLGPDVAWTWDEIRIYAVEVRLPDTLADRDVLSLGVTGGDIGAKVERRADGTWVRSPRSPAEALPLELSMTGQFPKLDITTSWSLWAPGGPGEPDLNAVIDTLLSRGWTCCP